MKELSKLQLCVYNIGGLLLVAGIIVPLFSGATAVALYLYLLGALMFSSMQVLQKYEGKNITLKRLRRQQILGALMLLLAGGLIGLRHPPSMQRGMASGTGNRSRSGGLHCI